MDYLVKLGGNSLVRRWAKRLPLPVALPPQLRRRTLAWRDRMLADARVTLTASAEGPMLTALGQTLAPLGTRVTWAGAAQLASAFQQPADAWAEPVTVEPMERADTLDTGRPERCDALLFDATQMERLDELDELYRFFQPRLGDLSANGRVIVLGRPVIAAEPSAAVVMQALEGFTRSLAKELGRRGVTVNLVRVSRGAEARSAATLAFLLSDFSSFVSAQPLYVTAAARAQSVNTYFRALQSRVALVTGAARGIGAAIARALSREGARVVLIDRPEEDAAVTRLARELNGLVLLTDLAFPHADTQIADFVSEQLGALDIIVHNAGVTRDKTLRRMSPEQWGMALDVNLRAPVRINETLLQRNLLRDFGRIIVLSSVGGIAGNAGQTNYAASKAGLIGHVRTMSVALADRGITVNAVAPGLIETRMTQQMPVTVREAARRLSALGQGGVPEDVAEAVTFFALPMSSGLTGSVLRVCGGALVGA